jgi:ParB-like chromosome segregation protein Spo0J
MTSVVSIPIEDIRHRPDARHRSEEALAALCDSIEKIGRLINPVTVRPVGDGFEVVAGSHRLQACELLGWREIDCIIVEADDLRAELAMIDENLCRAELSPADRAKQTARRKAIHLEMHPETRHGGDRSKSQTLRHDGEVERFTAETAKVTGQSERTVQLHAERGEKIADDVLAFIQGTELDTGTYMDKLKRLWVSDQMTVAKRDLADLRRRERKTTVAKSSTMARRSDPPQSANAVGPTYDELRSAVLFLSELQPDDYLRLCPPTMRAAMFQRLAHLEQVFGQVREGIAA